ncbi:hypothetical protein RRG51_03940 [Mycoplasmopsis cynos]|uniref:hypothetical protein n=1 Tax=Mycoplasmopsis cynos TaxID=171284 RepID=UPI002AFFE8ED|nr:hypothetical protein [Mycoplasmopsis cynos]WQQ16135.1 hypothetical protein RRG51_03940 [Mycoplasmopsis cynos]
MNKYKKIFSGLGLLSISTLVGASVVACANKKHEASDSSTEAIDQNNNQGNSTTPEQEKPGPNDQGNSSKPKEGENTPGNPAPQAPKAPEKPESPKNPENSTPGTHDQGNSTTPEQGKPEQNDNTGQGNGSNSNKQEENKGKGGKGDSKQENKPTPTPQPKPEAKSMELLTKINQLPYPKQDAKAKELLIEKVNNIKAKKISDEKKFQELVALETTIDNIKVELIKVIKAINDLPYPKKYTNNKDIKIDNKNNKNIIFRLKEKLNSLIDFEKINNTLQNEWKEKVEKYNQVFKNIEKFIDNTKLINRFLETDLEIDQKTKNLNDEETLLIYHIYDTVTKKYHQKINELKLKPDMKKTYTDKFKLINHGNIKARKHDVSWLLTETKKIIDEFKNIETKSKSMTV